MTDKQEAIEVVVEEKSPIAIEVTAESTDHEDDTSDTPETSEALAASEEDGQDNEDPKKNRRKEDRIARRERQRRARDAQEHKLQAANERIAELENKLAQIEKRQNHMDNDRLLDDISEEERVIERIKYRMTTTEDRKDLVEMAEQMHDAKDRLRRLKERAEKPKEAPPAKRLDRKTQNFAQDWMAKNRWYDPEGVGADSKMVLALDQQLMDEGWDAKTQDYWDELQDRVEEALPHRFRQVRRSAPVAGNRSSTNNASNKPPKGFIQLSPERKEALVQAGVWDDPVLRAKYAKRYQDFDKEEALRGN